MNKKIVVLAIVAVLCGCKYSMQQVMQGDAFQETQGGSQSTVPLRAPSSIIVCRSKQCAPAKLSMSREYIYNSLLQLFENNNHQTALVCQANSAARTCTENYITMPIKVGVTPAYMYIDSVKITDVLVGRKNQQVNLILNYNVTYNGQSGECAPARSVLFARNINHVLLEDIGYRCKMTTIGYSTIKTVFSIDYIDLDFGFIGGYYSIGMSGTAYGGGSGYMLLRLPKEIKPLQPVFNNPQPTLQQEIQAAATYQKPQTSLNSNNNFVDGGVQVFPLAVPKATLAPTQTSAPETETIPLPAAEQPETVTEISETTIVEPAPSPETPMQVAPASYSVTSGNKLAEELKKANGQ